MKDIHAIRGAFYLQRAVAEGEHEHQDFKFLISDARKIARSLSAFANNSGGHLLIGVKDNGVIAGVRNEEDIYVVEQAAQLYCRPECSLKFDAFKSADGAMVIRASIEAAHSRPVMAQDADGRWHAYYRVADENILATPLMVKAWQRKASDQSLMLQFSDAEKSILNVLATDGPADIVHLTAATHLSSKAAEEIITHLYALDLIAFRFIDRQFRIALNT